MGERVDDSCSGHRPAVGAYIRKWAVLSGKPVMASAVLFQSCVDMSLTAAVRGIATSYEGIAEARRLLLVLHSNLWRASPCLGSTSRDFHRNLGAPDRSSCRRSLRSESLP